MRSSPNAKVKTRTSLSVLLKLACLLAITLFLGACARNRIIKVNNGVGDLKNAPEESRQDEKQDAAQIQTQLSAALMQQGNLKEAYEHLQKAIGFDGNYTPAHTLLAILYERTNQVPKAESEYRAALSIDPKSGDANNNLGYFLCHHGQGKEGLEYLKRALADPFYNTPAKANTNAGECLAMAGDRAGAEGYLRKALEIDPKNAEALYQMASLQYAGGDAFRARGFLQRYEALGQSSPEALLLGYEIETRLGDADAARTYANRLSTQFPDSEQVRTLTGRSQ